MLQTQGRVTIEEASRYLQRLCFHFSRKIAVQYNEHEGSAEFPWGHCELRAQGSELSFACRAADAESLTRVRFAIDSHVTLFSRKNPVEVSWSTPEASPRPGQNAG